MPKRILIIGLLFCLVGAIALWNIATAAVRGQIHVNFAVLMLPVGIGLLRGKLRARWWAAFYLFLLYAVCGLVVALVIANPAAATVSVGTAVIHGPAALPYSIEVATIVVGLLEVVRRLLYSKKASDYFERQAQATASPA